MELSKNICIDRDTLTHFIGVILDETIFHEITQQKHFIGVVAPKTIDYYNFTQTSTNIETVIVHDVILFKEIQTRSFY